MSGPLWALHKYDIGEKLYLVLQHGRFVVSFLLPEPRGGIKGQFLSIFLSPQREGIPVLLLYILVDICMC